jgi:hypothetical protein
VSRLARERPKNSKFLKTLQELEAMRESLKLTAIIPGLCGCGHPETLGGAFSRSATSLMPDCEGARQAAVEDNNQITLTSADNIRNRVISLGLQTTLLGWNRFE